MSSVTTESEALPYLIERNAGYFEYQLPISVKAVVSVRGKWPLLKNERDEWELPGGKLELGERPETCVGREIEEELGITVAIGDCIYTWVYEIFPNRHVFVVTYLGQAVDDREPAFSHEHKELVLVEPAQAADLNMPQDYRVAIQIAIDRGLFNN
jgi:mutator protein MutT